MPTRFSLGLVVLQALLMATACTRETPSPAPSTDPNTVLAAGKALYEARCAVCHGTAGDGLGTAAYLLNPRPRDFTSGKYRIVSTKDGTPTDEDLVRTITRGMPGSAMPSWAQLPEADRRALVAFIKTFADWRFEGEHEPLVVPPEPANDAASIARGRTAYETNCKGCHGDTGKGDGSQKQENEDGTPTRPRDLTRGLLKGEPSGPSLFLRIRVGLRGAPMPANSVMSDAEVWDTVHYIQTLIPPGAEERGVQHRQRILAARVAKLPRLPADEAWAAARAAEIVLMPLSWRDERVESVAVEALHDGKDLALRLSWRGPRAEGPDAFRDGAAVQFSTTVEEPSFTMGHKDAAVEILLWQSPDPLAAQRVPADDGLFSQAGYPDLYAARDAGNPIAGADRPALALRQARPRVRSWAQGPGRMGPGGSPSSARSASPMSAAPTSGRAS